jgi:hypothetical protein
MLIFPRTPGQAKQVRHCGGNCSKPASGIVA